MPFKNDCTHRHTNVFVYIKTHIINKIKQKIKNKTERSHNHSIKIKKQQQSIVTRDTKANVNDPRNKCIASKCGLNQFSFNII